MPDRDLFDLEMSPGVQPPSGIGDRILVGVAGLALVGGLFVAVVNALPDDEEAARASEPPSASPSPTPPIVPTPEPPRVVALVEPDVEIVPPTEEPGTFGGWIRALADLVIRSGPLTDAEQIGVLKVGDFAFAQQEEAVTGPDGWLSLQSREGWIASVVDGQPLVHRYEYPSYRSSGWISGLAAGPNGFVATIERPVEGPTLAGSTDGARWRAAISPPVGSQDGYPSSPVWGPAGWLAASYVAPQSDWSQGRVWIWGSSEGVEWTRLGMLDGVIGEYPEQLVASERGYLLVTSAQGESYSPKAFWQSSDGLTWTESKDPNVARSRLGDLRIAGFAGGFYLWGEGPAAPAFSADGLAWRLVANGPAGVNLQVTPYRDRLLAIDLDRGTLAVQIWNATIARGQMLWTHRPEGERAFAGGIVTRLVSDGTQLYAFGWDRSSFAPLVWTGDVRSWTRSRLPASFQGTPVAAAAGPSGVVVVGRRPSLRGDNPIFWHRTASGGWLPEVDPILPAVPDPSTDDCPALPTDFAAFTVVDAAAVIVCHGNTPTTFRAWSGLCDGCGYGPGSDAEPAWLINPDQNLLGLSPTDWSDGGLQGIVVNPSLPVEESWLSTWLEVTGHFDDPASATCRVQPSADEIGWFSGPQEAIDQCRQTFVVTAVHVVSGP